MGQYKYTIFAENELLFRRFTSFQLCNGVYFFFFNDTPPTEISSLPLHDALPISRSSRSARSSTCLYCVSFAPSAFPASQTIVRSEEHTSELQSLAYLVCRLLLEKKKCLTYP